MAKTTLHGGSNTLSFIEFDADNVSSDCVKTFSNTGSAFLHGRQLEVVGFGFVNESTSFVDKFKEARNNGLLKDSTIKAFDNALNSGKSEIEAIKSAMDVDTLKEIGAMANRILKTSLGDRGNIWIDSAKRHNLIQDFQGNPVEQDGTFDIYLKAKIEKYADQDPKQLLVDLVNELRGVKLQVRRKSYKEFKANRANQVNLETSQLVCIDFVGEPLKA